MSTISFRFTKEQPNVLFGTKVLRFDKLVVNKGHITELEFLIMWQSKEQTATGETIVSHSIPFQPLGFVDTYLIAAQSSVYEFRKVDTVPIYHIGENMGVELVAHHAEGEFDCTLSVEIDPM